MFTPCFINDIDPLPEPLLPVLADQAAPIAVDLFDSAFAAPDEAYLRVAIRLLQRILAIRPADHLSRPAMLSMLGIALSNLSERTGDQATLDEAVDALREAAAAIPADDAPHAETLSNLGNALRKRFELTGVWAGLDDAIDLLRKAVDAASADDAGRSGYLFNLGLALINALEKAVEATSVDHPDRALYLFNFGAALEVQYEQTRAEAHQEAALSAFAEAAEVRSAAPSQRIRAAQVHPDIRAQGGRMLAPGGRALVERPGRAMNVKVSDVLAQDQLQVPLARDQHPVQALAPGAGYPPLRDRVRPWRPDRGPDDPHADRSEHRVERSGELGVPVTDQELEAVSAALEVHQEVAGLLGHPLTRGVGGDPDQVHAPGAVLDEKQDVQAPQEHGIDVEEIRGEDRLGLPGQEHAPDLSGPPGCGIDARVLENLPRRRRRELTSQAGEFAVDAPVTPARLSCAISSTSARTACAVRGRPGVRRG
jgi:hypothetical protein